MRLQRYCSGTHWPLWHCHSRAVHGRIVVGHGLENDFGVLGLSHPRHLVRDTAHDLPRLLRTNGKPRKLRHIAYEWLGLTIQGGDGGHDPCEDARAACEATPCDEEDRKSVV